MARGLHEGGECTVGNMDDLEIMAFENVETQDDFQKGIEVLANATSQQKH
jgi:hypothetical protein